METFLVLVVVFVASIVGTTTGFGLSTVMIPVMILFIPASFLGARVAKGLVDKIP